LAYLLLLLLHLFRFSTINSTITETQDLVTTTAALAALDSFASTASGTAKRGEKVSLVSENKEKVKKRKSTYQPQQTSSPAPPPRRDMVIGS
jgi:hypothetical protein